MRKAIALGAIAALAVSSQVFAKDGFDYTYVEGDYVSTNLDSHSTFGLDVDGDGFGIQGAAALSKMVHAYAQYTDQDFDFGIRLKTLETGLGINWSVAPNVDLIGRVGYAYAKIEGLDHDNGFALQTGVRARVTDALELEGLVHYTDLDDAGDNTTFRGAARWSFTNNFSVNAGAEVDSDGTAWFVGARYSFALMK